MVKRESKNDQTVIKRKSYRREKRSYGGQTSANNIFLPKFINSLILNRVKHYLRHARSLPKANIELVLINPKFFSDIFRNGLFVNHDSNGV